MAINQSQVDYIISTASADDPEVKLQNLQDEVDLLKKSVKKLLIDLRERLNETENPFIVSAILPQSELPPAQKKEDELKDKEQLPALLEEADEIDEEEKFSATETEMPSDKTGLENPAISQGLGMTDKNALMLLKKQLEDIEDSAYEIPKDTKPKDRPKLKKLHKLFEWVSRMVKKYGHDRLLIMIESYQKMGYITDDACTQVEEISKLMPEYIGDLHEISSEEFVAELYILNRILSPEDSSLDREMIEVMMDKKEGEQNITALKSTSSEETSEEDWIEMLEKF